MMWIFLSYNIGQKSTLLGGGALGTVPTSFTYSITDEGSGSPYCSVIKVAPDQAGSTQHGSRSMSPQGSAGTESGHGRAQNEQTRQQPQPQFTRVGSNAPVRCVPSHDAITLQV